MIQAITHQPAATGVTPRDLNVVQDAFNRALAQLQALPALATTKNPPSSSATAGDPGSIHFDKNFLYICVAKNVWRRVALGAF